MDSDRAWEKWGSQEPYYAVLTHDQYRSARFNDSGRESFFRSGVDQTSSVLDSYTRLLGDAAQFGSALDFGCGVGRLTIPLSGHFKTVCSVDVSQSMLDEAQRNCELFGVRNVRLARAPDFMQENNPQFDLVLSFLVFQHIRPHRGEAILTKLLSRLAPGGMAAIQLTYTDRLEEEVLAWLRNRIYLRRGWWLLTDKPWVAPMEMHPYSLSRVFSIFESQGLSSLETTLGQMGKLLNITIVGVKRNT